MSKPICVLISDVHYSLNTLALADAATRQAIRKANDLYVPLVVSGDLHDTKANLRGECVKAMIETFKLCSRCPYILRGNHDSLNEKSKEHSLDFLKPLAIIADDFGYYDQLDSFLIAYQHDPNTMKEILKSVLPGTRIIMHQGINGSSSGEYIQDKSAIEYNDVKNFRVISGHYHTRQDIKTGQLREGNVGLFSYVGNPFTLGFGEANDPPKGFQILMDDGTLEFVPTNLRKHIIVEMQIFDNNMSFSGEHKEIRKQDLLWVKVSGTKEAILKETKQTIAKRLGCNLDFRLDFIPTDTTTSVVTTKDQTQGELLDSMIDSLTNTSDERKERLKQLWKNSIN